MVVQEKVHEVLRNMCMMKRIETVVQQRRSLSVCLEDPKNCSQRRVDWDDSLGTELCLKGSRHTVA